MKEVLITEPISWTCERVAGVDVNNLLNTTKERCWYCLQRLQASASFMVVSVFTLTKCDPVLHY